MAKRPISQERKGTTISETKALKKRYKTQFDPTYKGAKGEINTEPSKTVPDQNLSVKQLLLNHTRGMPSGVNENHGEYFDMEIPRYDDITEQVQAKKELIDKIKEQQKIIDEKYASSKAEADAKKEKEQTAALTEKIKADLLKIPPEPPQE